MNNCYRSNTQYCYNDSFWKWKIKSLYYLQWIKCKLTLPEFHMWHFTFDIFIHLMMYLCFSLVFPISYVATLGFYVTLMFIFHLFSVIMCYHDGYYLCEWHCEPFICLLSLMNMWLSSLTGFVGCQCTKAQNRYYCMLVYLL